MQDFAFLGVIKGKRSNFAIKTNEYEKKHFLMDERSDAHVKQLFHQREYNRISITFESLA